MSLRLPGRSAGGGGASALRLPVSSTRAAPSWAKRSASPSFCASTRSNEEKIGRLKPGRRRQRLKEEPDMRALISTQRNAARLGLEHEVGPDLRFDQHGEIGTPMLQEAPHEVLMVERDILMQHAFGQAGAREPRRRDGGGGEQHAQLGPLGGDRLDHRQRGIGLAHARGMEPDQKARRARRAGNAVTLGPAVRLLLAAARAPIEDQGGDGRGKSRQQPIRLERQPRFGDDLLGQGIASSGPGIGPRGDFAERASRWRSAPPRSPRHRWFAAPRPDRR